MEGMEHRTHTQHNTQGYRFFHGLDGLKKDCDKAANYYIEAAQYTIDEVRRWDFEGTGMMPRMAQFCDSAATVSVDDTHGIVTHTWSHHCLTKV